ncbi:MAG: cupin domain-containing protein [Methanospirillaceae archaeon]|nr:cupin domain-containing protein [Methanospirillaceae archaeon]
MMKEKKQNLYAKPLQPGDLVSYEKDTVESRMLMYEKAGTISVLAFPAKQRLSEHIAPYDGIVFILEGDACIAIDGVPHQMHKGEIMLLPAEKPYIISAVTNCKMMLTVLHE